MATEYSKAGALHSDIKIWVSDLEKLGYNNKGLDGLRTHLIESNYSPSLGVSIWYGAAGFNFAKCIQAYEDRVKKLYNLAQDYLSAAKMMMEYNSILVEQKGTINDTDTVAKAGAVGGTATGAAAGAMIGSAIPVAGTAAGAVIGGAIGFAANFIGGAKSEKEINSNYKEMLDRKEKSIEEIINQSITTSNFSYEVYSNNSKYNQFALVVNELKNELSDLEKEATAFSNVGSTTNLSNYYDNEQTKVIAENLTKLKSSLNTYIWTVYKFFNKTVNNLQSIQNFLNGKSARDNVGSYYADLHCVPLLYDNTDYKLKNHPYYDEFGPVHGCGCVPTDDSDSYKFDLQPGDEGLLDLSYIQWDKLARSEQSVYNGQNNGTIDNKDGWIPENLITKKWWGYHTKSAEHPMGQIRYKVYDDGTVVFFDWNEREKKWKSMAYTSYEALQESLERQGSIDKPGGYIGTANGDQALDQAEEAYINRKKQNSTISRAEAEKRKGTWGKKNTDQLSEVDKDEIDWNGEAEYTPEQIEAFKKQAKELGMTYEEYMEHMHDMEEQTKKDWEYERQIIDEQQEQLSEVDKGEIDWNDAANNYNSSEEFDMMSDDGDGDNYTPEQREAFKKQAEELGMTYDEYVGHIQEMEESTKRDYDEMKQAAEEGMKEYDQLSDVDKGEIDWNDGASNKSKSTKDVSQYSETIKAGTRTYDSTNNTTSEYTGPKLTAKDPNIEYKSISELENEVDYDSLKEEYERVNAEYNREKSSYEVRKNYSFSTYKSQSLKNLETKREELRKQLDDYESKMKANQAETEQVSSESTSTVRGGGGSIIHGAGRR